MEEPDTQRLEIKLKGYTISYVKVGNGPIPVFAFPGMLAPVNLSFTKFINLIQLQGAETYTFYCWDTPGYFKSSPPVRKMSDISFEVDADIAHEFVYALGHKKCNIIGHSAGAQIALKFAIKYTYMVDKILLISGFNTVSDEYLQYFKSVRELSKVSEPFRTTFISNTKWDNDNNNTDTPETHWSSWVDFNINEFGNRELKTWNKRYEPLKDYKILIVTGELDKVVPEKQTIQLHEAIPSSMYKVFPDAGHRVQFESPEEFYICFHNFMSQQT